MMRLFLLGALLGSLPAIGCRVADAPTSTNPAPTTEAGLLTDEGYNASVASDASSGVAYATWVESAGDGFRVRLVSTGADGNVSEPLTLDEGAIGAHSQAAPVVAVGPEGTVHVVWTVEYEVEGRRFPASDLVHVRSTDGGRTFSEPKPVHADPGFPTGHSFHSMTIGPDGTVYVAWLDGTAHDRYRMGQPTAPTTQTARDEDAHDEMESAEEPGTELVVAHSIDNGQTFAVPVVVAQNACPCCRTTLDVSVEGTLTVAWRQIYDGNMRDMALARSRDGGRTFSEPVRVHADGWSLDGCPHAGPAIATDGDGTLHVLWFTGAPEASGLRYASSVDGGRSFATTMLQPDVPLAQVRAVRDGTGRVWIAWEDRAAAADVVRVRHAGSPDAAEQAAGTDPSLAPLREGWILVRSEGTAIRIQAYDSDEVPTMP